MTDEQRCGNCKWWDGVDEGRRSDYGPCDAPEPASSLATDRKWMLPKDGTDCPCWKAREDEK